MPKIPGQRCTSRPPNGHCWFIGAMTGTLGTDSVNSKIVVEVKVFGDSVRVLWDIEKLRGEEGP